MLTQSEKDANHFTATAQPKNEFDEGIGVSFQAHVFDVTKSKTVGMLWFFISETEFVIIGRADKILEYYGPRGQLQGVESMKKNKDPVVLVQVAPNKYEVWILEGESKTHAKEWFEWGQRVFDYEWSEYEKSSKDPSHKREKIEPEHDKLLPVLQKVTDTLINPPFLHDFVNHALPSGSSNSVASDASRPSLPRDLVVEELKKFAGNDARSVMGFVEFVPVTGTQRCVYGAVGRAEGKPSDAAYQVVPERVILAWYAPDGTASVVRMKRDGRSLNFEGDKYARSPFLEITRQLTKQLLTEKGRSLEAPLSPALTDAIGHLFLETWPESVVTIEKQRAQK